MPKFIPKFKIKFKQLKINTLGFWEIYESSKNWNFLPLFGKHIV
jgi:hypothetical protein